MLILHCCWSSTEDVSAIQIKNEDFRYEEKETLEQHSNDGVTTTSLC